MHLNCAHKYGNSKAARFNNMDLPVSYTQLDVYKRQLRTVGGVIVLLSGMAFAIGLVPVLQRFAESDAVADSRWSIAIATLEGIGAFFPLGAGMGTFPEAFRRFHPADIPLFVNHAHNDYLEWLFEGGLLAAGLLLLLLALYLRCLLYTSRCV